MVKTCFNDTFLARWKKILGIKQTYWASCKHNHSSACLPLHGLVCWCPLVNGEKEKSLKKRRRIIQRKNPRRALPSFDFMFFAVAVRLLNDLMDHKDNSKGDFNKRLSLFDSAEYLKLCPRPIYLSKIKEILYNGKYTDMRVFVSDVRRVFQNALIFNHDNPYFRDLAQRLLTSFEAICTESVAAFRQFTLSHANHSCDHCRGNRCGLCGYKCLQFREIKLRCSKRDQSNSDVQHIHGGCGRLIDWGSAFFRTGDRGQYWCEDCYRSLPDEFVGMSEAVVRKSSLERGLFNVSTIEPWIRCIDCNQWFHRICVLHTGVAPYHCEACVKVMVARPPAVPNAALLSRLPDTPLTRFLHQRVTARLVAADPEHGVSVATSLHIRVVSCRDCVGKMDDRLSAWVRSLSPDNIVKFPYTSKAIALFQNIEGSLVLLFVMYVHEYSSKCPAPNARTAYLAYLDSVCLMRPRRFRSAVYQAMVAGYSVAIKQRGFHKLYIWSCPPAKGQNYVLHNHPAWQRTPDAGRLRRWYGAIVRNLCSEGTVLRCTTLHDAHFGGQRPFVATRRRSHQDNSPRSSSGKVRMTVPFFEGDYWPEQAEVIIRDLERENIASEILGDGDVRRWWQERRRSLATRHALRFDAGGDGTPTPGKRLHWLLSNVASRIANMSKEFLVLNLIEECCRCGLAIRSGTYWGCASRSCCYCICSKCLPDAFRWTSGNAEGTPSPGKHSHRLVPKEVPSWQSCAGKEIASCPPSPAKSPLVPPFSSPKSPVRTETMAAEIILPSREVVTHSMHRMPSKLQFSSKEVTGSLHAVTPNPDLDTTTDTEALMPPTIFDQRLDFLWFCQREACQFDELRRAKFATKKILTHLFDVDKCMERGVLLGAPPHGFDAL